MSDEQPPRPALPLFNNNALIMAAERWGAAAIIIDNVVVGAYAHPKHIKAIRWGIPIEPDPDDSDSA